jgi:hypothetical protein
MWAKTSRKFFLVSVSLVLHIAYHFFLISNSVPGRIHSESFTSISTVAASMDGQSHLRMMRQDTRQVNVRTLGLYANIWRMIAVVMVHSFLHAHSTQCPRVVVIVPISAVPRKREPTYSSYSERVNAEESYVGTRFFDILEIFYDVVTI